MQVEIEHKEITESDNEVGDLFIDQDITDWERAAYMVGLSSDTEKVDERLWKEVMNQLNVIRAGLDRQQKGIIMQREALDKVIYSDTVFGHLTGRIEIHVLHDEH